jgi:hypothetical protein
MKPWLLYIDPGSGSYLLQALIASVLGVLFYFKHIGKKIKSFFFKAKKDPSPADDKDDA